MDIYKRLGIIKIGQEDDTNIKQELECFISIDDIRKNTEKHFNFLYVIENEHFHLRKVLLAMQEYLDLLKLKQKITDEAWIEDFI
ncbi:hypothetical protein [Clostridium cochlearium]|uniref:Short NACHT-associated C-terminal domain-containing protein n=1 Tax=Clostridium cochlearium TaxID=1494 RepID=A0A2X2W4Y9_CLOCO|nr:hypothetical protein [Clostridium cochlearium]SQB35494.1 Uncharacterised protein [Clostridium cochlearium]